MSDQLSDHVQEGTDPCVASALVEGWLHAFVNRSQPYALQQADGTYRWVYEECIRELLAAHLAAEVTLALSSTDARGRARWACLDVDVPGSLPQLLALRDALAETAQMPGLVVGSRRGGHLWLLVDEPVGASALRHALRCALDTVATQGIKVPAHELYADAGAAGTLGHAVRLPLGVHRKTGVRYPPYGADGLPCVFTSHAKAAASILEATPRIPAALVRDRWEAFLAGKAARVQRERGSSSGSSGDAPTSIARRAHRASLAQGHEDGPRVGTRSAVICWVDARISPLDLLADLAPETEMKRAGRGYLGWCPFHDDRAWDDSGRPGTPSFYVVHDRRFGWNWRCLSTNCIQSSGPMRHSFRLWQELLGLSPAGALAEAAQRWPRADPTQGNTATEQRQTAERRRPDGVHHGG
jgi:hypothetical protein